MLADLAIEEDIWCIGESILMPLLLGEPFPEGRVLIRNGNIMCSICIPVVMSTPLGRIFRTSLPEVC